MNPSLCVFAALLLASSILGAPAPRQRPFVSGWSNPVDPDRDCKIIREKGTLIFEMPKSYHDYNPLRDQFNAPRLFREHEIEGDFLMEVRVRIDCRPSVQSTVEGQPSFVSAGFLVILPDDFCIRKEFGVSRKESRVEEFTALRKWLKVDGEMREGGSSTLEPPGWKGDRYLRLERRDKDLSYSISSDGKHWHGLGTTVGLGQDLKLGLAAYSSSTEPSKIRFDQLKFTQGKKKSK